WNNGKKRRTMAPTHQTPARRLEFPVVHACVDSALQTASRCSDSLDCQTTGRMISVSPTLRVFAPSLTRTATWIRQFLHHPCEAVPHFALARIVRCSNFN